MDPASRPPLRASPILLDEKGGWGVHKGGTALLPVMHGKGCAPSPSLSIPSENGGNGGRQESGLVNLAHEMMPIFSSRAERGKAQ